MFRTRYGYYLNHWRSGYLFKQGFFVFWGALLVAVSLQLFLVKNYVIDGGIIGISIILSHLTGLKVGMLLFVLNTPFLLLGYFYLGKRFLAMSFYAIAILTFVTNYLEPYPAITYNPVYVIIFGGICLGLGVGLIIRYGGCLDGTEVLAILFSQRTRYSIGQYVFLFNFFIFGSSILIFGINAAVYSLATFFIAYKTIDLSVRDA